MLDPFCGCATTCIASEIHQRQWIGIDLSPKAVELVKLRMKREVDLTEHPNLLGQVIHRTDTPDRLVPEESRQIHIETLFGQEERTNLILSEVELGEYRSYKHTMYGQQEGKCNGCGFELPFRLLEIDHIKARAKGGTNEPTNLQLLCSSCNSRKGTGTQKELKQKLRAEGTPIL